MVRESEHAALDDLTTLRSRFALAASRRDIADLLRVRLRDLTRVLYHDGPENYYRTWEIRKRAGGTRTIKAPRGALASIQSSLNLVLQALYDPKPAAHGFVRTRSVVTNAERHVRKRHVLNVDLEDFFPTINFGRVRGLFLAAPFNCTPEVATLLAKICCVDDGLAVGAPTSPAVSNMICLRMDSELLRLAQRTGCWYSRYADDLTFSTNRPTFPLDLAERGADADVVPGRALLRVIHSNGFRINEKKFRLQSRGSRQLVTGLVVNEKLNVRRRYVRQIRAMLNAWDKYRLEGAQAKFGDWYSKDRHPGANATFRTVLRGKIAYLGMVRGDDDDIVARFREQYENLSNGRSRFGNGEVPAERRQAAVAAQGELDRRPIRIAHLSDFHFDASTAWDADYILDGLARLIGSDMERLDLVVVTGDIARFGKDAEYEQARRWIEERLLPAAQIDSSRLLVVPGNHDVDRSLVGRMEQAFQEQLFNAGGSSRDEMIQETLADDARANLLFRRFDAYAAFLERLGQSHVRPWWIKKFEIDGVDLRIAGVCTSWCSYRDDEQGRLLVGLPQVSELLGSTSAEGGSVHVALMHHPLEWMYDGDKSSRRRLEKWSHLHLRGHLHDEDAVEYSTRGTEKRVTVAAGSAYQGSEYTNGVQLLEVYANGGFCDVTPFRCTNREQGWYLSRDVFPDTPDGTQRLEFGLHPPAPRTVE